MHPYPARISRLARIGKSTSINKPARKNKLVRTRRSMHKSQGTALNNKWSMDISSETESIELATGVLSRMRGMLFRDPDDVTRLLVPCNDIHTFGMRFSLDVAFISKEGNVLEVHRDVRSRRRLKRSDASIVAERFSKEGEWLHAGDTLRIGVNKQ